MQKNKNKKLKFLFSLKNITFIKIHETLINKSAQTLKKFVPETNE